MYMFLSFILGHGLTSINQRMLSKSV